MLHRRTDSVKALQIESNQRFDFGSSLLDSAEQILLRVARGKTEDIAVFPLDPLCRKPPEFAAQGGDIPMLSFLGQTKSLESQHQIVSPEDDLHVSCVGPEAACWNLGHEHRVFEFAEEEFLVGSVAVESPDPFGHQIQISKDHGAMVSVPLVSEEIFLTFFGLELNGSADDGETMFFFEARKGIGEFGGLPTFGEFAIAGRNHSPFQRLVQFGYNHVSQHFFVEMTDQEAVVKGSIESQASAAAGDRGRNLLQDVFEEVPSSSRGMNIAGPQFHPQADSRAAFAGEDRSIGRFAVPQLGDIADRHALLFAIDSETGRIGIDRCAVDQIPALEEFGPELVVCPLQTLQALAVEPPEKRSQSIVMRKFGKSKDRRYETIVNQGLSVLDPADSRHDREDMRQEQVRGMVSSVKIAGPAHVLLKKAPQVQRFAKLSKKNESTPPSESVRIEGKYKFLRASAHATNSYRYGSTL